MHTVAITPTFGLSGGYTDFAADLVPADSTTARIAAATGLAIAGGLGFAAYKLWRRHKVWSVVLTTLALAGTVNLSILITGKAP